jgi:hypothetical protein
MYNQRGDPPTQSVHAKLVKMCIKMRGVGVKVGVYLGAVICGETYLCKVYMERKTKMMGLGNSPEAPSPTTGGRHHRWRTRRMVVAGGS